MIEDLNVDWKAESYGQLNLAHVTRNKKKHKKETKTHASAHLDRYKFKISEDSPKRNRKTMEERICAIPTGLVNEY